ncbi:MAG: HAD hydrolase family protein, partial [Firmicutes bacterium]|nr:HAD hydrolase family protein [Bacillota bacterium]
FSDEVLRSDAPVLVDFWAPWCGPCRAMMPVIDKLAKESGGRYRVGKVNVDHFPDIAKYYGIPHSQIVAFGDAENDIEMLDMAGVGVAMVNATDLCKAHANVITKKDNNHNGIVGTLKKLIK